MEKIKNSNKQFIITGILTIGFMLVLSATIPNSAEAVKPKYLCEDYGGDWKNGKCKGLDEDDLADYEDVVCDEPGADRKFPKICS